MKKKVQAKKKPLVVAPKKRVASKNSSVTKQEVAEALKAHDLYWKSYITGDVKTLTSLLSNHYTQIGSVENEVFFSKRDAVKFVETTIDQVNGNVDMRNRITKSELIGEFILVSEQCDLYVLAEGEWAFYSKFRASSLMEQTDSGWRLIHQHSSVPDLNTQDGESIAIEKIAVENLQLRNAIKRRTIELEQKNRELQIEAVLERVRARAMAMHHSHELSGLIGVIYKELTALDVVLNRCFIMIFDPETLGITWWMASGETEITRGYFIQHSEHPPQRAYVKGWQNREERWRYVMEGEEKKKWDKFIFNETEFAELPEIAKLGMMSVEKAFLSASFNNFGCVSIGSLEPLDDKSFDILVRFAKVFDLTYTRFNDLQKAEEQARESQIQLALERVRARTMAMQKSDELPDAAGLLFDQVQSLGMKAWSAGFCIWDKNKQAITAWMSSEGILQAPFRAPLTEDPSFVHFREAYERGESFFVEEIGGEELAAHYKYVRSQPAGGDIQDSILEAGHQLPTFQIFHCAYFLQGFLLFITYERVPEAWDIFKRFAKVFEQTYTRFLDLQKAEAQARESQIEASLERVRSRTMAMHKSEELSAATMVLFEEFKKLQIENDPTILNRGFISTIDEANACFDLWATEIDGSEITQVFKISVNEITTGKPMYAAWKAKSPYLIRDLQGEQLDLWLEYLKGIGFKVAPGIYGTRRVNNFIFYSKGFLGITSSAPLSEDSIQIMIRLTKVFEQTYTRFLDLQKAEAQARESQVQLALERVRARTMAMQKSSELAEAAQLLYQQFLSLGVKTITSAYMFVHEDRNIQSGWTVMPDGTLLPKLLDFPLTGDAILDERYQSWKEKLPIWKRKLEGEENKQHHRFLAERIAGHISEDIFAHIPDQIFFYNGNFSLGYLFLLTTEPLSIDDENILVRFAKVFEQTYTRFLDLQRAEAQAREARIEASLERVRSKAMAMHSSQDLADTIGVFYHELELFSITPRRCGVGLLNKETRVAELSTMNTTEQGKSIEIVGKIKMEAHPVLEGVYDNWIQQEEYHPVLRGSEIKDYYTLLRPQIPFPDYPNDVVQYGYFFFFPEGGVYAWTDKEMEEEELKIYRRFTSVLSLTYKRYKDLQQAEDLAQQAERDLINLKEEKKKTEDALTELRATQTQLIQSEKMASLGELTAGIAHEIQNPLNFVNNFSEVSTELVDEMNEELLKGNTEDAKQIAVDLKQNLEKINHHGKRAGDIVKSMLQHSRSSSGVKELTDLNSLADEYLRLAYHGLRAKDKSFNATMKTDFDESIGSINIIPQDIGRVILNLITNAFYVVNEKQKSGVQNYEPTVSVSTKKNGDKVYISVKDNGNGIPEHIREKIFQPFFTTKPTGQGTGLGLSLSYDIVKAHGGELKVETKEGEGTEFSIQLRTN